MKPEYANKGSCEAHRRRLEPNSNTFIQNTLLADLELRLSIFLANSTGQFSKLINPQLSMTR